jgi:general secretion pathway protein A
MYEDFYNFTGKPFQLTPDQKFFYNSKVHNRAMAYLRYGLEQSEGFIVITGAVGTGKTMLVRNLFGELDTQDVMAAQLVTTQVEPEDMLRMVCASFGLAHEGQNKATMLHNLEALAGARHAEGKRVLLVVDEAQNLPPRSVEELRMLSNFQSGGKSLFQSFLLGQEEFKRTLQHPGMEQVRQRIIASYHLEPLAEEDIRGYIEFRLGLVGWKGDPAFDPETFQQVHAFTGGIPRRINTFCDRLLLFGCLEELHSLGGDALETVIQEMRSESGQPLEEPAGQDPTQAPFYPEEGARPTVDTPSRPEPRQSASASAARPPPASPSRAPVFENGDLAARVQVLEEEVTRLKKMMNQERKLLRKAVLLQLDMEGLDEIE